MKEEKKKTSKISSKQIAILACIAALILIVIFILIIIAYSSKQKAQAKIENRKSYENAIQTVRQEEFENGEIVPKRYNMFERMYEGDVDTSQVYPDIYNLVIITIPDIQKRFAGKSEREIENFYYGNEARIEKSLGIKELNDYIKFVNYVKDLDLGEYVDSSFDELHYQLAKETDKTADRIPIKIEYTKQTITIIMEIDIKEKSSNPIRFLAE